MKRALLIAVTFLMLFPALASAEEYVVLYKEKVDLPRDAEDVFSRLDSALLDITLAEARELEARPNVLAVEPNRQISATNVVSWGLDRIDQRSLPLDGRFEPRGDGAGQKIYIIDSGIRADHIQFSGRVLAGWGYGGNSGDCNGHGTHVAGTAAGTTVGVARAAQIIPVRVLDCYSRGEVAWLLNGINWILANHSGTAVANLSLSLGAGSEIIDAAVRSLADAGVVPVVAAGNNSADACESSPGREPLAWTVGALDSADARASFSNWGSCVDVWAPGVGIRSAHPTTAQSLATMSGTSMAAPHVAGAFALERNIRTSMTGDPLLFVGNEDLETFIQNKPATLSNSRSASFSFSSSEAAASFECRLGSAAWSACLSPYEVTSLSSGEHIFEVRSRKGEAVDASPATWTWVVDTEAPETSIVARPANPSSSASASFAFSSPDTEASFQCRLDTGSWERCIAPRSYEALSDGSHTFEVRGTDPAGNVGAAAQYVWSVSTTSPETTITAKPPSLTNVASATISFVSLDPRASFECRKNESAWRACGSPHSLGNLSDGLHTFEVRSIDLAGNVDTSPASAIWRTDTEAPSLAVSSGPSDFVASAEASFHFVSEAEAVFECRLNGRPWATCASPQSYSSLADGAHTFDLRARDEAGNTRLLSRLWTVDTAAPVVSISSAPERWTTEASAALTFSSESGASFECRINSEAWSTCTSPRNYSSLAEGTHLFEVRARDRAGNSSLSKSASWTVDRTAPFSEITPASPAGDRSPIFMFRAEEGASFECRLSGSGWSSCSSPHSYSLLPDGEYVFEVRARDRAGNVESLPALFRFVINEAPGPAPGPAPDPAPDPVKLSGPGGKILINSPPYLAVFSLSGPLEINFNCQLNDKSIPCGRQTEVSLSPGSYTFKLSYSLAGQSESISRKIKIALSPPQILQSPSRKSPSSRALFQIQKGSLRLECRLDSGAWRPCSRTVRFSRLRYGRHLFQLRHRHGKARSGVTSFRWQRI